MGSNSALLDLMNSMRVMLGEQSEAAEEIFEGTSWTKQKEYQAKSFFRPIWAVNINQRG